MANNIEMVSLLESGLKLADLRQSAIANNLANLETPGFKRSQVSFEARLADALAGEAGHVSDIQAEVTQPLETEANAQGNDVNLDMELTGLIKNTGRYRLYMRMLSKTYQQMGQAIAE